jgi:hypothetical protein
MPLRDISSANGFIQVIAPDGIIQIGYPVDVHRILDVAGAVEQHIFIRFYQPDFTVLSRLSATHWVRDQHVAMNISFVAHSFNSCFLFCLMENPSTALRGGVPGDGAAAGKLKSKNPNKNGGYAIRPEFRREAQPPFAIFFPLSNRQFQASRLRHKHRHSQIRTWK